MVVTFDKLLQSLKDRSFSPVYFLHGPEPYFIDIIADYVENHVLTEGEKGFNQVILYGRDIDANALLGACTRYPMMASHQVVIVKEAQDMKTLPQMEQYFEKPVPSTILVICHKYKSLDKRLKMAKVLEKNAVVMESQPLKESMIPGWINQYIGAAGYKMAPRTVNLLAEYTGAEIETLARNLDKLMLAAGDDKTITDQDIQTHVGISREYNVFELSKALAQKDTLKLTKIVNYMVSTPKENPLPVILAVLYGFYSKLTALQMGGSANKDAMKALGIWPAAQQEYAEAFHNYKGRLPRAMQLLQEYDLRFKGVNDTGTDDGELLREMVFKLAYL